MYTPLINLVNNKVLHPPHFVLSNLCYLVRVGSHAYGIATPESDEDFLGFTIPPKDDVFPHLWGEIPGFGTHRQRFEVWRETGRLDKQSPDVDYTVYSIVHYFNLCMGNNPNMIDSLFVPFNQVLYTNQVGQIVRENRHLFLSKMVWPRYKGFAYSQLNRVLRDAVGKRRKTIDKFGFDTKAACHSVRLILEVEQILLSGDLDLQKDREILRAVRDGLWEKEKIISFFVDKEKSLEKVYHSSSLPLVPQEDVIKELLLNCLEHHYGSISNVIQVSGRERRILAEIYSLVGRALGYF